METHCDLTKIYSLAKVNLVVQFKLFQALPSLIIAQNSLQFQRWDLFLEVIRLPFLAMNDLPKTDDKWTNLLQFILDHKIYYGNLGC